MGARPVLRTLIGAALRRTRLTQRRTLADVALAARVSVPYLSEVERGRKEASSEVLAAVCDALRIDLSDLLAEVWRDLVAHRAPVTAPAVAPVVPINAVRRADAGLRAGGPFIRPGRPGRGEVLLLAA